MSDAAGVIEAAVAAQAAWRRESLATRIAVLERFGELAAEAADAVAERITAETRKTRWESQAEAGLLQAKIGATVAAWRERHSETELDLGAVRGRVLRRPMGVAAIIGPFNFPAHLPNGHAAAALLAGNAVVFKPSDKAPETGALLAELWQRAGIPEGLFGLVQGGVEAAQAVIDHAAIASVLFTGSYRAGQAIAQRLADRPEVLLALEMGGNNPLIVDGLDADDLEQLDAAAYHAVVSAFVTAGQRCTCARRILVTEGAWTEPFIERFLARTDALRVDEPESEPEPFYGPVIDAAAGHATVEAQAALASAGCAVLRPSRPLGGNAALLAPGVVDASGVDLPDAECFGPLTALARVSDLDAAIASANATRYGLAAALLSPDRSAWERLVREVDAGVVNWNLPTTGASGKLPFGGLGRSGNHRPAGAWAVDYCTDPVGVMEAEGLTLPGTLLPGAG